MKKILWVSKNKKWTITNINGKIKIDDSWNAFYPIIYSNNTIAYDNSFLIPKYVKDKINKLIKYI